MKVKAELDKLDTVPQLGEKLAAISKLKGKEADAPQKQIVTKIVETSLSDIAERLKQNDFSGATLAVEAGLGYAKGDERLLEQKERIRQEQLAFERAEAKRIEVARQQAAQEELANRTALWKCWISSPCWIITEICRSLVKLKCGNESDFFRTALGFHV